MAKSQRHAKDIPRLWKQTYQIEPIFQRFKEHLKASNQKNQNSIFFIS